MMHVGFIGCGQMGRAILSGLLDENVVSPEQVFISAKSSAQETAQRFGVKVASPVEIFLRCEAIFLGIKPYQLHLIESWINDLKKERPSTSPKPLMMSMLAGTSFAQLKSVIGDEAELVRIMPNLPAQVRQGVTLICADPTDQNAQKNQRRCETLLAPLGLVEPLHQESDFHAATAISGCGPAYLFNLIEALADAGVHEGLPREVALRLSAHTVMGSGALAVADHPAILKDRVTSPGGVTITGVRALERAGFRSALIEAVIEATTRSRDMERSH
jgi:pyrroline-5-carboxylate reductase